MQSLFFYIWRMKLKMRFGFAMALVMFLGIYLANHTVPNQQILVQFSNQQLTSDEIEASIEVLTERLHNLGVDQLQIGEYHNGQIKITYYSDSDVIRIQSILGHLENVVIEYTGDHPLTNGSSNDEQTIKINVTEIQNPITNNWDFEGTQVIELNQKSDQYYFQKLKFGPSQAIIAYQETFQFKRLLNSYGNKNLSTSFDYKVPEVRAGPVGLG